MQQQENQQHRLDLSSLNALHLIKEIRKLFYRVEKILVPSDSVVHSGLGLRMSLVSKRMESGDFFMQPNLPRPPHYSAPAAVSSSSTSSSSSSSAAGGNSASTSTTSSTSKSSSHGSNSSSNSKGSVSKYTPTLDTVFSEIIVDWDALESAFLAAALDANVLTDQLPVEVIEEVDHERKIQAGVLHKLQQKEEIRRMQERNNLPIMPGKWHKEPFTFRKYTKIEDYVVSNQMSNSPTSQAEEVEVISQLQTDLDGFVGQAYNYDDHGLTEEWMMTFKDGNFTASEDDLIKTQVNGLMEIMLVQVTDRVNTQNGVLHVAPIGLGHRLKESPVWGIDCYTRRMVEIAIQDRVSPSLVNAHSLKSFIEGKLLPSINAQEPMLAHDMNYAVEHIIRNNSVSELDRSFALAVKEALSVTTTDIFKIHPKGTGVICSDPNGIRPHEVISDYLGEIYPPYKWCEKLDVVEQAQKIFELKPTLPDFYNILLERPRSDPKGYGLLYVDASQKANMGSSCSHSCNANCTSAVVARNGRLVIVLTTNRFVNYGEELCMDYYSITTSEIEWRAAICLCGMSTCRGSFLHYATQEDLQQVLNQNCGPLWRYATLLRACANKTISNHDVHTLRRHGINSVALGKSPAAWISKYAADSLKFVEFERKALPCALMRTSRKNMIGGAEEGGDPTGYTYHAADLDARSVMEQRIQSLVCCFSMVQRVLSKQNRPELNDAYPLKILSVAEATEKVWLLLRHIPDLMEEYLVNEVIVKQKEKTAKAKKSKIAADAKKELKESLTSTFSSAVSANIGSNIDDKGGAVESMIEDHPIDKPENMLIEKPTAAAAAAAASTTSDDQVDASVTDCIRKIRDTLSIKPLGYSSLKGMCLDIRKMLLKIQQKGNAKARLNQLCDILVLWAHTTNFSVPQEYDKVESDDVYVVARELGTNIPRSKIFKPEPVSARRSKQQPPSSHSQGGASGVAFSTYQGSASSQSKKNNTSHSGKFGTIDLISINEATPKDDVSEMNMNIDGDNAMKSDDLLPIPTSFMSSSSIASAVEVAAEVAMAVTSVTDSSNAMIVETESRGESRAESPTTFDSRSETPTFEIATSSSSVAPSFSSSSSSKQEKSSSFSSKALSSKEAQILDPNEPVYTGQKHYDEFFVFNQLMCWFNAGTDDAVELPALFGCGALPSPASCFGPSEIPYTTKQRDILIELLRDEKAQMQVWPATLQKSFGADSFSKLGGSNAGSGVGNYDSSSMNTGSNSNSSSNSSSNKDNGSGKLPPLDLKTVIFGSPMLDGFLGKVGSVNRVLEELVGSKHSSKSSTKQLDNSQIDNMLPPEQPTAWVQCDLCVKWRRIPWNVDSESLPEDKWYCSMNIWDPENASCDAPQDAFDPDQESTVEFSKSLTNNSDEYEIGMMKDLWCNKNLVYYEAQIKEIKTSKGVKMVKFHFLGWGKAFDEWVEADSERIQVHNLFTIPGGKPIEQEKFQGVYRDLVEEQHHAKKKGNEGSGSNSKKKASASNNSNNSNSLSNNSNNNSSSGSSNKNSSSGKATKAVAAAVSKPKAKKKSGLLSLKRTLGEMENSSIKPNITTFSRGGGGGSSFFAVASTTTSSSSSSSSKDEDAAVMTMSTGEEGTEVVPLSMSPEEEAGAEVEVDEEDNDWAGLSHVQVPPLRIDNSNLSKHVAVTSDEPDSKIQRLDN